MARLTLLSTALVFALCCTGCGDSHDSLTAESIVTMKSLTTAFEGIKDVESAKAAKPKLQSLMEQMNSIQKRQRELGLPTETDGKAILDKYGKEMEEVSTKMQAAMMRVAFDPAIAAELDDIASKMPPG